MWVGVSFVVALVSQTGLCPSKKLVLATPELIRWEVWNDPTCSGPCKLEPCDGGAHPCCLKSRFMPKTVAGKTVCAADGNTYSCTDAKCSFLRPCASDDGLLHCSCGPPTDQQISELLDDHRRVSEIAGYSPCTKVEVGKPLSQWNECDSYLRLPLDTPKSASCENWKVPTVIHTMGKRNAPPWEVTMNMAVNLNFTLHHMGDRPARHYVETHCGKDAGLAYDCFLAPAFRADLGRYCILWAEGGVYLDSDIIITRPIEQVVDMCDGASIGEDIPQLPPPQFFDKVKDKRPRKGKQMKILAGPPKHPLWRCMLDRILDNVANRRVPPFPMGITGPTLLQECYEATKNTSRIHVTYRDTRGAKWPYTGMMGPNGHLAFESTKPENYLAHELQESTVNSALKANHYHELYLEGKVYKKSCLLQRSQKS